MAVAPRLANAIILRNSSFCAVFSYSLNKVEVVVVVNSSHLNINPWNSTWGAYFKFRRWHRVLIWGARFFHFFQIVVRFFVNFNLIKLCTSPSEISDVLDPVHLEELCNITPLLGLGLLNKVGWALGNESADLHYHLLRWS